MHVHLPTGDWVCGCVGHYADSIERYFGSRPEPHSVEDARRRSTSGSTWWGCCSGGTRAARSSTTPRSRGSARSPAGGSSASARVDPNREDALERLARFPALGLRGLKLHPTMQAFDPGDDRFLPFFDAAAELGLVLLTHAGHERARRRRAGRPGPADRPRAADPARPHRRPPPADADRARPRRLAVAPRGRRDGAAQVQRLPRHLGLEVPLPARRGQARDPAPAARPVLLRHGLPDVRPRGLPVRARPARAAAGRRERGPARQRRRACSACDAGRGRPSASACARSRRRATTRARSRSTRSSSCASRRARGHAAPETRRLLEEIRRAAPPPLGTGGRRPTRHRPESLTRAVRRFGARGHTGLDAPVQAARLGTTGGSVPPQTTQGGKAWPRPRPDPGPSTTSSTASPSRPRTGARPTSSTPPTARRSRRRRTRRPRTSTAPSARPRRVRRLGRTRRRASARWRCCKLADALEAHGDELAELEAAQRRQAAAGGQGRRDPRDGRQPALLRRRRAQHGGQGRGRVPRGLHVADPPRAGRRDRPDRALELPADDGDLEDRPGARRPATRSSSSPPRRRR